MTCSRKSSISSLSNVPLHAVTDVHGRTFGVWTLLTCTLCFLCALNLENRPLYLATFLSFIYAIGHFLTEYLIYHTMAVANLSTVGFFAGTKFASNGPLFSFCLREKLVHQSLINNNQLLLPHLLQFDWLSGAFLKIFIRFSFWSYNVFLCSLVVKTWISSILYFCI